VEKFDSNQNTVYSGNHNSSLMKHITKVQMRVGNYYYYEKTTGNANIKYI